VSRSPSAPSLVPPTPKTGEEVARLRQRIDWAALERRGWDGRREVFAPAADDPVFGFRECRTVGCEQLAHRRSPLCWSCGRRWRKSTSMSFEEFCSQGPARHRRRGLCRVCCTPGHQRSARAHGLCSACWSVLSQRGQSMEAYLAGDDEFPPATPRPSFGPCLVVACERWAAGASPPMCESHQYQWRRAGRPGGENLVSWSARQRPFDAGSREVALRGLSETVRLEVLYGLQCRAEVEQRTTIAALRTAVNLLRRLAVPSVLDLSIDHLDRDGRLFLAFARERVVLALASPATEVAKDDWDLRVFGRSGRRLHFGDIRQPWLKEGAKRWAAELLDSVGTPKGIEQVLRSLVIVSESLVRHRADGGADPAELSRADASALANDLAHLEATGRLSHYMRRLTARNVERFLREARAMGLTRPGGALAGLPEDVALHPAVRIRAASTDDEGRALPHVVVDQLLEPAALDLLEAMADTGVRAMVELQARVGRRTGELCALGWDCVSSEEVLDEAGQLRAAPVLVHDMPKVAVRRYRLPIDGEAAAIIARQQALTRARYPDTPIPQLALFPALARNPRGVKTRSVVTFRECFRAWVDALPTLVDPAGQPFDRSVVTPYSLRHTYAQRHADSGTPVEVLAALMGHRRLTTTQAYYRVNHDRKRKAVDLLASLQIDRHGERTRPTVERLLDSEAVRDGVGQVAVPFGVCREPTNVRAQGQACPFRHQCFGCTHFHSDPSFLPELRAHLGRLLGDRERLRASVPELEDWARNGAIPSAEEIAAVRRVIDRCQELVANLGEDERAGIEEAVAVLRRSRAQPGAFPRRRGPIRADAFPQCRSGPRGQR